MWHNCCEKMEWGKKTECTQNMKCSEKTGSGANKNGIGATLLNKLKLTCSWFFFNHRLVFFNFRKNKTKSNFNSHGVNHIR